MRPSRNLAALILGILLLTGLCSCATVPRTDTAPRRPDRLATTGPPIPRARRAPQRGNVFIADAAPILTKTGHILLDIATAVLPEPNSKVDIWTHGYDYSDSLVGIDHDGDEGQAGCMANTAVEWCPFFLAP